MVYKKIRDTIPSLSGLLLAGLMAGNCGKKTPPTPPAEELSTGNNDNKQEQPNDTKDEVVAKKSSPAFSAAVEKIVEYLANRLGLDHLKSKDRVVATSADFQVGTPLTILNSLCGSFKKPFYPRDVEEACVNLKNVTFRTGKSPSGEKHKVAWCEALNAIAKLFKGFDDVYAKMLKLGADGLQTLEVSNLLTELEALYKQVDSKDPKDVIFSSTRPFFDAPKAKLLSEGQMVRFLTDKEANGSEKKKQYGMPALLESEVSLWVNATFQGNAYMNAEIQNIGQRGAGIQEAWRGIGFTEMFDVAPLPLFEDLNASVPPKQDENTPGPGYTKFYVDDSDTLHCEPFPESELPSLDSLVPISRRVTFAQCIFSLFKGEGSLDFIKLSGDSEQNVVVKTDNEVFQKLCSLVHDPEAFAKALAGHVENPDTGLTQFFPVPSLNEITGKIIDSLSVAPQGKATLLEYKSDADISEDHFGDNTFNGGLIRKLASMLAGNALFLTAERAFKLCKAATQLKSDDFLKSSASLEQRVCFSILPKLLDKSACKKDQGGKTPLIVSGIEGSQEPLVGYIKDLVKAELESNALVYKDGAEYKSTKVSRQISQWIDLMRKKLSEKHGSAYITYKYIATTAAKPFDIDQIVKAMKSDYWNLKSILTAKIGSFLDVESPEGAVDVKAFFPNVNDILLDADRKALDKIRLDYLKSKKNQTAAPLA